MDFLSTLSKGSDQEKIAWSFRFYDVNKDGIISRDEMMKVSNDLIRVVGKYSHHTRLESLNMKTPSKSCC